LTGPAPSRKGDLRLLGLHQGQAIEGPRTVHFDLTNACNTNCITCWDHSPLLTQARPVEWKRRQVDAAAIEQILDDLQTLGGLRAIILSGQGDPMVHPQVYRIIEAVKSRKLHVTIITNLIPADPEQILALDVDQLLIGIHGASEASYRAFHPSFRQGEWQRLHGMLESFRDAGRRYKHVQVICDTNWHELVDMVEFGHRYMAERVNFKLASLKRGTETCAIDDRARAQLLAELVPAARQKASELSVTTNLTVFEQQLRAGGTATAPIEEIGCFMGYSYARVLVDRTVLYCCNTDVVVGKLEGETRFSDLWRGPRWNQLRQRMREGRYYASCRQCGKVNQNVKLADKFKKRYGEARYLEVTGRGLTAPTSPRCAESKA
jgi:MoaA/NifB/PqqE/SkfB family radical SAM enzyme